MKSVEYTFLFEYFVHLRIRNSIHLMVLLLRKSILI